ncbi:hypothetical protein DYD21_20715 [Rhodohalobacter sp. SW132]|uniref:hypothetical protein n=1 Tax=Rhodohalobacter sp. SW132 TaxID=2293433 RepID=UPI000E26FA3E|nr:hypothetical protein [Rhodohalobacter sp. SW132]REL23921.1 hypothetical protein DYD21_20715 [Rhodohalobacter sp. SW132]
MKKLIVLILVICLGFHFKVLAQVDSTIQGELSSLILEDNPEFYVQYRTTRELTDGFIARFFFYKIKDDNWPGGVGFEITHPERTEPLWYTMIHGDFGPHSVQLIDIDHNGKLDLFFYAGFEDVFSTFIYSSNYDEAFTDPYRKDNFIKSYENRNDYSVLIKLDGANQPLILDSGYEGNVKKSGKACLEDQSTMVHQNEYRLTITESVKSKIESKYREITGELDQYNFDYNMPDVYFLFNTKILDPIRLFKIKEQDSVDVTADFPNYLEWRIEILNQIKLDSSELCEGIILKRIEYLESYLEL